MKRKKLLVFLSLILCVCCVSDSGSKQVKLYQDRLAELDGKPISEVRTQLLDWKFELLDSWIKDNPEASAIQKDTHPLGKFEKTEIQQIFSAQGKYWMQLYLKRGKSSSATSGQITSIGQSWSVDEKYSTQNYTALRIVFKDGALCHYRVWGNVSSSQISGRKLIKK